MGTPPEDWGTIEPYGAEILPGTIYDVRAYDGQVFSPPVALTTPVWGDVVGTFSDGVWAPPDGTATFDDITAVVDRFIHLPGAPATSAADLLPAVPDQQVDFSDIPAAVDAFRGLPYPFDGPCP